MEEGANSEISEDREKLGDKKYILIVDDDPAILRTVAQWLSKKGYRAIPVESADAAIRHVNIERPDLVLLDIMMPDADGIRMMQEIKEIDKNIPVIMLTGVWDDEEERKCKKLGAIEYINKPVDLDCLEEIVKKIFSPDDQK
jgi:DNA-binding NtrC family response regulator